MTEQEQAFWEWYEKFNQEIPLNIRMAFDAGYEAATNNRKVTQ